MNRVAILGRSGGGKSTLTRALSQRLGLPAVHLDVLYWRPGWAPSETEPFRERLQAATAGETWIADGNFITHVSDLTLGRADTIIWIEQPRWLCLARALWRVVRERGPNRPDMAQGCAEKFDPQFLAYIWTWDRLTRPRVEAAIARHAPDIPVIRLRSDAEIAAFLARA
ncbi:adenylate kinase family enzyme [Caulobacter ginsengisoli]|uniref:Adenylate kinase family enzyme n=1 Tax=Caulobacter ginsengisoli TaxID=400775 RepID=A0ABU0ITJ3_9CAUL|nr:hypothetical protein [Caulobacter ginsengisoli]MDQ0464745.1 adenylate kinase family enzyme [Caulobacter ginsengisoli]